MSAVDHAHAAEQLESWAHDNLRRLTQPRGTPVATAGPMAQAATAQASLAVAHRLAALTDAVRGTAGVDPREPDATGPASRVALPTRWEVSTQDGSTPYLDEPHVLVAPGTYLVGRTDSDDLETAWTVCLRVEYAVDADGQLGVDEVDVVRAIADRLNGGAR